MKKRIIVLFVTLMLGFLMPINPVLGAPAYYYLLDDFDDYIIGSTSGVGTYLEWERVKGDHFSINGVPLGDLYIKLAGSISTPTVDAGFVNMSANHSGYYFWTDGYSGDSYHSSYHFTYFEFKNSSTNKTLVKISRRDRANNDNFNKFVYYVGASMYDICDFGGDYREPFYVSWNFYTDNIIQYRVFDDNWNEYCTPVNGLGFNTSQIGKANYTIDSIYIYNGFSGASNPAYSGYGYFDDLGYITEVLDLPDVFEPNATLGARCTNYNPSQGARYEPLFEIDPHGCSLNTWCFINHFFNPFMTINDIINDCQDCPWDMIPVKYFEHKTESYYNETIIHVLLPVSIDQLNEVSDDPNDYALIINDVDCGLADYIVPYDTDYGIVWEFVNVSVDGHPVFAFYSSKHTEGFALNWYWYGVSGFLGGWGDTRVHNDIFKFYDGYLSGSLMANWKATVCWYYNNSTVSKDAEPSKIPTIEDFDDFFGMGDTGVGYVEWLGWNDPCYYKIGLRTMPSIVYNLTGYGEGNGTKTYYFAVYKIIGGLPSVDKDEIVYNGFIEVANKNYSRDIRQLSDFNDGDGFTRSGQYYIMVYNASSPSVLEEFAHQSTTIIVCPADRGGGGGGVFFDIPYEYKIIIGIGITIIMSILPLIFALQMAKHRISINVPPLIYVAFFLLGVVTATALGFFDAWILIIILLGLILAFAITWLNKQKEGSVKSEE